MSYMRMMLAIVLTGLAIPAEGNLASATEALDVSDANFARARNAEIDAALARVDAARTAELERMQNEEIDAASAASAQEKFNRERNQEINASLIAGGERARRGSARR